MTGKINIDGILIIHRKGREVFQDCPFDMHCSHRCPHFGEPQEFSPNEITLDICMGKTLKFSALEDNR